MILKLIFSWLTILSDLFFRERGKMIKLIDVINLIIGSEELIPLIFQFAYALKPGSILTTNPYRFFIQSVIQGEINKKIADSVKITRVIF